MDRSGANPAHVVKQMRERLITNAVQLQIPIAMEAALEGVIDLVAMKAVYFLGESGEQVCRETIPHAFNEAAMQARSEMLDALAFCSEHCAILLGQLTEVQSYFTQNT